MPQPRSTRYQEGVLVLSDGTNVPFLCRPISDYFDDEQLAELHIADVQFLPPVDRTEELENTILDKMNAHLDSPTNGLLDEDKIEGAIDW